MELSDSKYWLDRVVAEIMERHPRGEITVASGHSPSGRYHVGFLREPLTASAIVWNLKERGREARHFDFVDDFDVFRKVPSYLPAQFKQHLGKPLYLVPDPEGSCHQSYADHFLSELEEAAQKLGIEAETVRSHQQYQAGKFAAAIERGLEKLDEVKAIIIEISGRELEQDWSPVQILSDDDRLDGRRYRGWDKRKQVVYWKDESGEEGEVSYAAGRVKLNWRLDWAARWKEWKVQVEPFGRDHATKGGSYDTGKELVSKIFGSQAPYPVPYEFINLSGHTKKMSKSAGGSVSPGEALDVMPPEILRFLVFKSRPNKMLTFDSGLGLYNLVEEYSKIEQAVLRGETHEFEQAYRLARAGAKEATISSVPFSHLVAVFQSAQGDFDELCAILERTGYEQAVKTESDILKRETDYVKNWLEKYAPDEVKFEVQQKLPKVKLSDQQKQLLDQLATRLEDSPLRAQGIHDAIYELAARLNLAAPEAFQAIYSVILGKDSGPKAGWFLASLDRFWLVRRLRLEI